MSEPQRLGNLQHAILRVLWSEGEASVSSITAALRDERDLALTTIATMLTKMEKRGLVSHKSEGRQFIYKARVSERSVQRSMVSDLTARLFGGDVTALVSHLLSEQEIDERELDRLKALIAERGSQPATPKHAKEKRRGR
jgi:BlaI family penicillinase repressor